MKKVCTKCFIEKDLSMFSKKGLKKDGTIKYNSICKDCHRVEARNAYQKNKETYLPKIKARKAINMERYAKDFFNYLLNKECVDCGINDIRVLEFDHINDNKEYNISDKRRHSPITTLLEEIEKCEIVCANCHRIRTLERMGSYKTNYWQVAQW